MILHVLFPLLLSFSLSSISVSLLLRKIEASNKQVPCVGGFAIWLTFIVTFIFVVTLDSTFFLIFKNCMIVFITSTMMFLCGAIDDKKELSASTKIFAQSIISLFAIFLGLRTHIEGIGVAGNYIVTLIWIVGITNAFNHLDVVDGLSAGIAFICAMSFCTVSLMTGSHRLAIVFVLLAGSILGFLKHNFPSAKVFMGNAGSHFLGFVLSMLSIMISYASSENRIALLVPIIILGVPIFDTLFVMWMRILKQKRVWEKSDDHFPLCLIAMGHSKMRTVIFMYFFTIILNVGAVAILKVSAPYCYMFVVAVSVWCIAIAQQTRKECSKTNL